MRNDLHSWLWRYPSLHRKKWVFPDHVEHRGSQLRLFLQDWVKAASSLKEHIAVFSTQRKKTKIGGTVRYLTPSIWISCKNSSKPTKSFFILDIFSCKLSYLDRDSLMCSLGLILTESKLFKTGTISSNEEGSAYVHQILNKSWHY